MAPVREEREWRGSGETTSYEVRHVYYDCLWAGACLCGAIRAVLAEGVRTSAQAHLAAAGRLGGCGGCFKARPRFSHGALGEVMGLDAMVLLRR